MRQRIGRVGSTLCGILAIGFALTACTPAPAAKDAVPASPANVPAAKDAVPASPANAPAARAKPQYGGNYRFNTSNPRIGQDPHRTTGTSHFTNYGRSYSSLLRYKMAEDISENTFIIRSDLAVKWENPAPTTWVLHLRQGVKWHNVPPVNGREFVAEDVVYSINRLNTPGGAQSGYWQDLAKVEALDKYTVQITLKNPVAPFLSTLASGFSKMVAKEAINAGGGNVDNGPLIGTGAWFIQCTPDVECVFKRNPDYFLKDDEGNQLPYLDGLRGVVLPDVQGIFAAFRSKQLDTVGVQREERTIIERSYPGVVIRNIKRTGQQQVHIRNDKAPWNNDSVRLALSKSINRQEMVDAIAGGMGWFQWGWSNPAEDWFLSQDEFQNAYKPDVEGAKKLLAEAGYPNGIDASLFCANYGANDIPSCELLASQMGKAGIRVKINVHDVPTYLSKIFIRNGQFDDLAWGPQGAFLDPDLWLSAYYHSKGGRNSSYVNDPKLDQMIEGQRREADPQKRKQIVADIQRYLLQKNYQLSVYTPIQQNAAWPWVKNRTFSGGTDYPANRDVEYIWVDQEVRKTMGAVD